MSQKPISELRRRMLEDMAVRKFNEATCRNYIRHIAEFAKFLVALQTRQRRTTYAASRCICLRAACGLRRSTLRRRRCVFSLALPSIGLSSPGISPACTTRGRYRACFHPTR